MRRLDVVRCNKGHLWKVLSAPKDGMVRVSSVNQPLTTYRAPVADLTVVPGVYRAV